MQSKRGGINKANLGSNEIYRYLEREQIELIGEIPFSRSYAEKYARADLFQQVPEEIRTAHRQIARKFSEKGLIP